MIEILFWLCSALILWVYLGYPALLWLLAKFAKENRVRSRGFEPAVTLVVSAYNEAAIIARKIQNSLELDYPHEKLEILVVSDGSTDGTDEIVKQYERQGVVLLRMEQRGGKTLGLNRAVESAKGEFVIFSDANAMYDSQVVRNLVRNFSDESVGCVTGESRYNMDEAHESTDSENLYWRYELAIKEMESKVNSLVGGDGAIYAIRKRLFQPMRSSDLSDFVNPLQISAQKFKNVYERDAISYEDGAESFDKEFQRKVRIVNRAWRGLWRVRRVLNPFRYGFFAIQVLSHKLLRWLIPVFMAVALVSNLMLMPQSPFYFATAVLQIMFYSLAGIGWLQSQRESIPRLFYVPYYFCLVNLASLLGIASNYKGETFTVWQTVRE